MSDPNMLPPTNGAGWYSAAGQSVCFYAEYGTNQGMPPDNTFTGILVRAHSIIVDDFRNVTNWYDGNDQVIRFDANLTASLTEFSGKALSSPWTITIAGNMQVRLAGRLNHPTGTYPLTVEVLSFTLFMSDIGSSSTNAFLNIRTLSSPLSSGQLAVTAAGGGQYQVTSTLNVRSEAAVYYNNGWLPYWPDTNALTRYDLLPLQAPGLSLSCTDDPGPSVALQFQMRRNVLYILDHSSDLRAWTPLQTNYSGGCGLGATCNYGEAATNPAGFYRTRTTWVPQP